ncbi:MAG TPA: hypothetical protein DEQ61_07055 [Streptomyces sp.]|nr:hypothetical protein [Streptomyces sp.]
MFQATFADTSPGVDFSSAATAASCFSVGGRVGRPRRTSVDSCGTSPATANAGPAGWSPAAELATVGVAISAAVSADTTNLRDAFMGSPRLETMR